MKTKEFRKLRAMILRGIVVGALSVLAVVAFYFSNHFYELNATIVENYYVNFSYYGLVGFILLIMGFAFMTCLAMFINFLAEMDTKKSLIDRLIERITLED